MYDLVLVNMASLIIIFSLCIEGNLDSSIFNFQLSSWKYVFLKILFLLAVDEQAKLSCEVVMNTHNQTIERQDCYPAVI